MTPAHPRPLILITLLLLIIFPPTTYTQTPITRQQEAQSAFLNGDYNTAIIFYEDARTAGVQNAPLYFNLGTAYYRTGALGPALLNFRRAQTYIPRDPSLNQAIATIYAERPDLQPDPLNPLDRTAAITTSLITLREITTALLLGSLLLSTGLALLILAPSRRQTLAPLLTVLASLLLMLALLWGCIAYVQQARPAAVTLTATTLHSGPATTYLPLFDLGPAADLRIINRDQGWGHAVLPDGRHGWARLDAIGFISP